MSPPRPEGYCQRCAADDWALWGMEETKMDTVVFVWYCKKCRRVERVEEMSEKATTAIEIARLKEERLAREHADKEAGP